MIDFAAARKAMVDSQVRPCGVTDPDVVAAMLAVPRELFVPRTLRGVAYAGEHLPLPGGRFLLDPMVFAKLVDAAEIRAGDVVLDVGCASGYSTAVLSHLAAGVAGVESDTSLVEQASANLSELGIENAVALEGDLAAGRPDQGPYDVIVIEGGVDDVPETLIAQLKDGGRLVAVHTGQAAPRGALWLKTGGDAARRDLFDTSAPRLAAFARAESFSF
ncbi:protein-L-isoaspartate O-methyltransferase family protein [Futiania mangrovi]|uniref:Protein-L-isoaspartate O-methyltransferase n=1 Tax=Futiania mangrovi TaxID=2959716 RepID=A0A9J6PCK7_9PROT|nr:protein-L-isoaspartate O-methyltransferase [Futiania mangrovii]MCP1335998.1 protein-L-isoaspartate O-methyltransferase [Futiania mangrovii]